MKKKTIIVGGVAGGASTAARLRRNDENIEIIIFEKGPFVSFANCGLPYYIGNVIKEQEDLVLMTPELFNDRFNFDVRVNSEVISINREDKTITVLSVKTGETYSEAYDTLVLATGAEPFIPPLQGLMDAPFFKIRDIPDVLKVNEYIKDHKVKKATVIGGGYVGVEMAENLAERNIQVDLVEMMSQVLGQFDFEMSQIIHQELSINGVNLHLGKKVIEVRQGSNKEYEIITENGDPIKTEMIIVSVGIRPESKLAKEAGLNLNPQGYIIVNEELRTSDPDIYAVGDAIEVFNQITEKTCTLPLAGPANRQGRAVADVIANRKSKFDGIIGSSVIKIFGVVAAATGLNERQIKAQEFSYEKVYAHPNNHAGYYPGASTISMKLLFETPSGKILGAQAIGGPGAEKRIDVIATSMFYKGNVFDLQNLELSYAPPYSSAKDPVNMLGFIASNVLKGDMKIIQWHDINKMNLNDTIILDVRTKPEFQLSHIEGAINIPDLELRKRINEIPKNKRIAIYCEVGFRGYLAYRTLSQLGYESFNLTGGYKTYKFAYADPNEFYTEPNPDVKFIEATVGRPVDDKIPQHKVIFIDARGISCPGPLNSLRTHLSDAEPDRYLRIAATDPGFLSSVKTFVHLSKGVKLISMKKEGDTMIYTLYKDVDYKDALGDDIEINPTETTEENTVETELVAEEQIEKSIRPLGVPPVSEISAEELYNELKSQNPPAIIIDVRQKQEWNQGHMAEAILIPLHELESKLQDLEKYKNKEIITVCHSGSRSFMAGKIMEQSGFDYIRSLRGGMLAWARNKYPIKK